MKKKKLHSNIPTKYAGIEFRSRTEARWAALYDLLGWSWTYEPLDYNGWIPDFLINDSLLVEIKPIIFFEPDIDVIQWDCEYPVMLSGIKPNLIADNMVSFGWDFEGDNYMLKERYSKTFGVLFDYGLSLFNSDWKDLINDLHNKEFCYNYSHINMLYREASNKVKWKRK